MTYVKTVWVNDQAPDLDQDHLNKIEQGIEDAHTLADAASADAATASAGAVAAQSDLAAHQADTGNPHATTSKQVGGRHHKNAYKRGAVGNDSTENTTVLQSLLDEIKRTGRGELYLPGDDQTVYRTRGLWVPPRCRIVSDGAKLRGIGASLDYRHQTAETIPNHIFATGVLMIAPQTQNVGADTFTDPVGVRIEGLSIIPQSGATDGQNTEGITCLGARDLVALDFVIEAGASKEAISVSARNSQVNENLLFQRFQVLGGRRNGVAADNFKGLTFRDFLVKNVTADSPADTYPPGMGFDFEPPASTAVMDDLTIERGVVDTCAAAGIGINYKVWDNTKPATAKNGAILRVAIRNAGQSASLPGGATNYGGIWFQGGSQAVPAVLRVHYCEIVGNLRGDSLSGVTNLVLRVSENDLRPATGKAAVGVTGYDGARSSITSNITS